MTKSKKKITSTEDHDESEIPPKRQKGLENTDKFDIQETKKKRKKSESKIIEISDEKTEIPDLSYTEGKFYIFTIFLHYTPSRS